MLPRIETPTYNLEIPSTKQTVRFRPFLIKEEKILLMAQQGEDVDEKIEAIKQIIRNCIVQDINVDLLATFDIEYIFINLRSKSIGNLVDLNYTHACTSGDELKEEKISFQLDLDKAIVEYKNGENHSNKIELTENIGMIMRYPNFNTMQQISKADGFEDIVGVIAGCVEMIYQDEDIFNTSDHTISEVKDFIENLTQDQFGKINDFFEDMPEAAANCKIQCRKCGFEKDMRVSGITDFFL
tara:strand:- start:79 stop:801 length:723 start_codon:yes stop_codon:yes gene_type:complete